MSSYCGGRKYPAYEDRDVDLRESKDTKNTKKQTAKAAV